MSTTVNYDWVCQHGIVRRGYIEPQASCERRTMSPCVWRPCKCGVVCRDDYEEIRARRGAETHSPYCPVGKAEREG